MAPSQNCLNIPTACGNDGLFGPLQRREGLYLIPLRRELGQPADAKQESADLKIGLRAV
jgi:hypothetical protein